MTTAPEPEADEPRPEANPVGGGGEAEQPTGSGAEVGDELDELVAGLKQERDEYLDLAQRAKADFENYRKRTAREAADAERRGKLALARELVPSIDSLERALAVAEPESEVARGLELVHAELIATLGRAGVQAYDPVGEPFDHAFTRSSRPAPVRRRPEPWSRRSTAAIDPRRTILRPARVVVGE